MLPIPGGVSAGTSGVNSTGAVNYMYIVHTGTCTYLQIPFFLFCSDQNSIYWVFILTFDKKLFVKNVSFTTIDRQNLLVTLNILA